MRVKNQTKLQLKSTWFHFGLTSAARRSRLIPRHFLNNDRFQSPHTQKNGVIFQCIDFSTKFLFQIWLLSPVWSARTEMEGGGGQLLTMAVAPSVINESISTHYWYDRLSSAVEPKQNLEPKQNTAEKNKRWWDKIMMEPIRQQQLQQPQQQQPQQKRNTRKAN